MQDSKRRGYITSIYMEEGTVLCDVEDADTPGRTYEFAPMERPATAEVSVPPVGSEVVVSNIRGKYIVTGILSTPADKAGNESQQLSGARDGNGSVSFVFGPREGESQPESLRIEYGPDGYTFDLDVDGDVSIKTDSNVSVETDGRVDVDAVGEVDVTAAGDIILNGIKWGTHQHPYTDEDTGDSDSGGSATITTTKDTEGPKNA